MSLLFGQHLCCPNGQEAALHAHDTPCADEDGTYALQLDLIDGTGDRGVSGGGSVVLRVKARRAHLKWRVAEWLLHSFQVVAICQG